MNNDKVSIVFMGSGPVAAESLRLAAEHFHIEAVVTKTTTLQEMKDAYADTEFYCVSNKSELDILITTEKFVSEVAVLIDFGIIVSKNSIQYFSKGIVNSHFSLLPELRGADPISFAILEGKKETGVSLMLLVEAMDEGPILAVGTERLDGSETGPVLTEKLIQLSDALLASTLPAYVNGTVDPHSGVIPKPISQEEYCRLANKEFLPSYTRKLTKADGILDFGKDAEVLEREVRAFLDWPKSRATLSGIDVVITQVSLPEARPLADDVPVGGMFRYGKKLAIRCGNGVLVIEKIKPAGKKEMDIAGFLNGYGDRLELSK